MWNEVDEIIAKYLDKYKEEQEYLKDNIQSIFNSIDYTQNELYSYATKANVARFKRVLEQSKKIIPEVSYASYLASKYASEDNIKNSEILEFLIMLEYIKMQDNLEKEELEAFLKVSTVACKQAEEECKTIKPVFKPIIDLPNIICLSLLALPNNLGYIWKDYKNAMIEYNTSEIYRQATIDIVQGKKINVDDPEFAQIFIRQNKREINENNNRYSGAFENEVDNIFNGSKLEAGKKYGAKQCRFIARIDGRTTEMCETLNNQIFNLDEMNTYQRYSDADERIVTYHTKGLVVGENLPPISNHFHYCRSTITYNLEEYIHKNYTDITQEWLSKSTVNRNAKVIIPKENDIFNYKGINYVIDNKNVQLDYSLQELEVANWLSKKINKKIQIIPKINYPFGTKTPDYKVGKHYFDLKTISGESKQTLYHSVYGKENQSYNFIFDVSTSRLDIVDFEKQIERLYDRKDTDWVDKVIIKKDDYISVFERK